MRISFIGDVMLGRHISAIHQESKSELLDSGIKDIFESSDFVFANLESPITNTNYRIKDHIAFQGNPVLLNQFNFVNCFSLANNHINDFGQDGMDSTVQFLKKSQIPWNGIYQDTYKPFIFEDIDNNRYALFTCTDMMNKPISKENKWNVLSIDDPLLDDIIKQYVEKNYFVMLYAHVGMLFTRYPNPPIREILHKKIDLGVELIVTAHSHVLGGMELYKNKPIFHSIGDFVMDGNSYRRRKAAILNINISKNNITWNLIPTYINKKYQTVVAERKLKISILKSWNKVSLKIRKKSHRYASFYNFQYRIEILKHMLSTFYYLINTRGIIGTTRLVIKRMDEVNMLRKWASSKRSKKRFDDEAISDERKKYSNEEIFNIKGKDKIS